MSNGDMHMVSLSPRCRISSYICSQELPRPDDCGQWKLHSKLLPTLKWLINSPVWRGNIVSRAVFDPLVVLEQK